MLENVQLERRKEGDVNETNTYKMPNANDVWIDDLTGHQYRIQNGTNSVESGPEQLWLSRGD